MKKASWKTTLFGILTGIGLGLEQAAGVPDWVHGIGKFLSVAGPTLIGWFARDNNVTSEQAQAK